MQSQDDHCIDPEEHLSRAEQMLVMYRHHGEEHCINYSSLLDQILDKSDLSKQRLILDHSVED